MARLKLDKSACPGLPRVTSPIHVRKFFLAGENWRGIFEKNPRRGPFGGEKSEIFTRDFLARPRPIPPYPGKWSLGKKNAVYYDLYGLFAFNF